MRPSLHQLRELPVEEREQQRADVGAVDVGVRHDDDLVVAELLDVEVVADSAADGGDERLHFLVLEHLVEPGALDVEDLAADRQDRLRHRVARRLALAARAVALDDEQLRLLRVLRRAVGELARHRAGVEQRLAPGEVARLAGRRARP